MHQLDKGSGETPSRHRSYGSGPKRILDQKSLSLSTCNFSLNVGRSWRIRKYPVSNRDLSRWKPVPRFFLFTSLGRSARQVITFLQSNPQIGTLSIFLKSPGLCKPLRVLYRHNDRDGEDFLRRSHLAYLQHIFGSVVNLDRAKMFEASPRLGDFIIFVAGNWRASDPN
jgi:hypothetical protein